jgi:hypothetical protein
MNFLSEGKKEEGTRAMATQNGESKTKYFEKTHCIWEMTKFLELINENNTVD